MIDKDKERAETDALKCEGVTTQPFTARLVKSIGLFVLCVGASFLTILCRELLPDNILRATIAQTLLYGTLGILSVAFILMSLFFGMAVASLLLQAYEIGVKVLNGTHEIQRRPPT